MRSRTHAWIVGLLVVAAVASGCSVLPPRRQFGQESPPPTEVITSFDEVMTARLPTIEPLAQVKRQAVTGSDISVKKPLAKMSVAWRAYLSNLNDGRLIAHPTRIGLVELGPDETFGTYCYMGPDHRYPADLTQPVYCPDFDLGSPQPAFVILPPGFTAKLQEFADAHGTRSGWVLAALVAGLSYARHLREEMKLSGVSWPDGTLFDYCTAGIGLRAVFPPKFGGIQETQLAGMMTMLDQLLSPPDEPELRLDNLATGYRTGRLEACVA